MMRFAFTNLRARHEPANKQKKKFKLEPVTSTNIEHILVHSDMNPIVDNGANGRLSESLRIQKIIFLSFLFEGAQFLCVND